MKTILASDIAEITAFQLNVRPVFKIRFRDGTCLVLKAEYYVRAGAVASQSVFWSGEMTSHVSPALGVELLTAQELVELQTVKPSVFNPFDVRGYLFGFMQGNPLFKMPYIQEVRDAQDIFDNNNAGRLLGKLKTSATMEALGKIVAVDLFSGSNDRFSLEGLANTSNLLVTTNLDEAMSRALDLVDDPPHSAGGYWGGTILLSEGTRFAFATKCIASLNTLIRSELSNLASVPPASLLMTSDALNFSKGIAAGAKELRAYLSKKARKGNLPQGVLTRMALLMWTSSAPGPPRPQSPTPFPRRRVFYQAR